MAEEIRLSIEETNKLRAQLGLPLLPSSANNDQSSERSKEAKSRNSKEAASLSIDETNRLRRSLGLRPLEDDQGVANGTYKPDPIGSSALKDKDTQSKRTPDSGYSLQVGHTAKELAQLNDGDVFTLEDKGILSDDDDCFVNEALQKQGNQEKLEREKRKIGARHAAPAFYDDELESEDDLQQIQVVGSTIKISEVAEKKEEPNVDGNITRISGLFDDLDSLEKTSSSRKPVTFKKSKGKSSSKKRSVATDVDSTINVPSEMVTMSFALEEENLDDLEGALTKARSEKAKARSRLSAEELAAEVRVNRRMDLIADLKDGLVFDGTDDFLGEISSNGDNNAQNETSTDKVEGLLANLVKEVPAVESDSRISESSEPPEFTEKSAVQDSLESPSLPSSPKGNSIKNEPEAKSTSEDQTSPMEGPRLGGILASLKYLRQSGASTSEAEKKAYKMKRDKEKEQGLIRIKISIQERIVREELEKDPVYIRLDQEQRDRIFDRVLSDRLVSEGIIEDVPARGRSSRYGEAEDSLAGYNPQVHVLHKNESGQVMDQKQAWKALSHRYHGLAPKNVKRAKVKSLSERTIA